MTMRKLILLLLFSFVLFTLVWNFTRNSAAAGMLTPQDHAEIQQLYSQYYLTQLRPPTTDTIPVKLKSP
jgi:hypothetical protein